MVTPTGPVGAAVGVEVAPRSLNVILRVYWLLASPALRSISDRLPIEAAKESFCAPTTSTSSVTALTTDGLSSALVGDLVDRQHADVLQHDLGRAVGLVDLARQRDVDVIARQDEAADAVDVVDPHGRGLQSVAQHRRQAWRAGPGR